MQLRMLSFVNDFQSNWLVLINVISVCIQWISLCVQFVRFRFIQQQSSSNSAFIRFRFTSIRPISFWVLSISICVQLVRFRFIQQQRSSNSAFIRLRFTSIRPRQIRYFKRFFLFLKTKIAIEEFPPRKFFNCI